MTEDDFQRQVIDLAILYGWLPYHTRDSRRSQPGFPDLVLVRDRILFPELKIRGNALSPHQVRWREAILTAGGDYRLWYPDDWDEIVATLSAPRVIRTARITNLEAQP